LPTHLGLIATPEPPGLVPLVDALLAMRPDLNLSLIVVSEQQQLPPALDAWGPRILRVVIHDGARQRALVRWEEINQALPSARAFVVHQGNRLVERLLWGDEKTRWSRRRPRLLWGLLILLGLILAPLAWLTSLLNQALFAFLLPTLAFPVHAAWFLLENAGRVFTPQKQAAALRCDLWLRFTRAGASPVLLISDCWNARSGLARSVPLPVPPGPRDSGDAPGPQRRFLFHPAVLTAATARPLLLALQQIQAESGELLELVCLGRKPSGLVPELQAAPVRWLGAVKPTARMELYRQAELTVLQGSGSARDGRELLPALRQGSPIVCADRPALRELLTDCPESVLFFQPEDATAIARAVGRTLAQRERYRQRQQEAYRRLIDRDWPAVAAAVLRHAA
jgi:hypothetical protein